jgi:SAM-dependent methyltransferase
MTIRSRDHWAGEAMRWAAWARAPGHDAYWHYRDAFFALVPPPGRATLEVGSGEGRVARDLAARGHTVTGVDLVPALARLAADAGGGPRYLVGDGAALPFPAGAFDCAVAYNSLMDVDDMPGAVRELARVLGPGGRLCVCVTHPLRDAGQLASREPDAPFVIAGSYFGPRPYEGTFTRAGLTVTFRGSCYALEDYARALEAAGLAIEALREPRPAAGAPARFEDEQRIPQFLMLRARALAPARSGRL